MTVLVDPPKASRSVPEATNAELPVPAATGGAGLVTAPPAVWGGACGAVGCVVAALVDPPKASRSVPEATNAELPVPAATGGAGLVTAPPAVWGGACGAVGCVVATVVDPPKTGRSVPEATNAELPVPAAAAGARRGETVCS